MTEILGRAPGQPSGLRERKKARTRATIREEALRLFREQGYHATTVEQIAAAAEVSPSTFFRYFPTKEDVVLQDDLEPLLAEAIEHQAPELGVVAAVRAAFRTVITNLDEQQWNRIREQAELSMTTPEVRARAMDDFARTLRVMTEAVARRTGLSPDDPRVRTTAGAIFGTILSATAPWDQYAEGFVNSDFFQRIDDALGVLEGGLSL